MSRPALLRTSLCLSFCTLCSAQVVEFEFGGTGPQAFLGSSVDFVGDLTGDGIDEFVAGAPLEGPIGARRGRATVYDGATLAVVFQWDGQDDWELGARVAGPGDIDLDGVPDVLVSARRINSYAGRFYLYSGSDGSVIYTRDGSANFEYMGDGLIGLGEADGDGWRDFAVSATGYSGSQASITAYSGRDGGLHWTVLGTPQSHLGYSIAALGDIDGDGLGDLIAGAPAFGTPGPGEVFVYSGSDGSVLYQFSGMPNARLGLEVSSAGDVDQDGTNDFLYSVGGSNVAGVFPKVRLHSGASGLLLYEWTASGYFGEFGEVLSPAGDQTGDGVADFFIGQTNASVAAEKLWLVDGASKDYAYGFALVQADQFALATGGELTGAGSGDVLIGIPDDSAYSLAGMVRGYSIGCGATPITSFCASSPNSVGAGATMSWTGTSSLSKNNLRLEAHDCPQSQFGIFYYGSSEASTPFGDGLRCVSGAVFRLPIVNTGSGSASFAVDLDQLPAGGGILGGSRRLFQFWYRDPGFGSFGFNLSDGLSVEFCM